MVSVQFSSVAQSCPTLCDPMNCSTLGLPVHHHLPEFTQTHCHRVSEALQPSHPLSSPSPPAPYLSLLFSGTLHSDGYQIRSDQISRSVAQSCPTLCDPMNRSTPGLPVHHQLRSSVRLMSIKSMMPSSHLILCRPLLLLPPIPPSIRVFSNESLLA